MRETAALEPASLPSRKPRMSQARCDIVDSPNKDSTVTGRPIHHLDPVRSTPLGTRRPELASTQPFFRSRVGLLGLILASVALIGSPAQTFAQANNAAANEPEPIARIVPLTSPISEEALGQVRRTALELQDVATREGREGYLILEIPPGTSSFHQCYALADFLTSSPFQNVTTLAWVPESVTGPNVLVALACNEINMDPDASLGDMGNGRAVPEDQQNIVRSIVARRRNSLVSEPLAVAMMDPAATLLQLSVDNDGMTETRLVTADEARQLREEGAIITETRTLSEAGSPTVLTGSEARSRNLLAARTAGSRRELVEAYGLRIESLKELGPAEKIEKVAYIELHDMIDEVFAAFAERQIERAVQSGAKIIIFEIDSPGGYLWVCQDLSQTIAYLSERGIKTVAYIPREAFSGGAILAVACDEIYMKPAATIGNAIPINMMGNMVVRAEEKVLSGEMKMLRDLAKQKNRPAAILEAFADKDLEVFEVTHKTTGRKWYMSADEMQMSAEEWIPGPRVPESRPGIAITVSGTRAHELLIAQPPVQDQDELKARLGIPQDVEFKSVGRTWVDSLVFNLNTPFVTGLLFFLAIVCIYIEMATMTGFFGILAALAFSIFFWSKVMGGTATGLEVALFVLGAGCLALELFVIPGFGVFGMSGILLILASLIMASQTFTGFSLRYDMSRAGQTTATLGAAIIAVTILSLILSHYFPKIPILRDMVLAGPGQNALDPSAPRLKPELTSPEAALLNAEGKALTVLRPAGKARIDGRVIDVVSDGPFISEGSTITVVQVFKNRIVVREVS